MGRLRRVYACLTIAAAVLLVHAAPSAQSPTTGSALYNITIATDAAPDLTDLDRFIDSATANWPSTDQKVWALFYWAHTLKRQSAPQVLHGFDVTDPIRNFLDYGYTMCSTASGINQSLYELLGLQHEYWDICNHTVSAVQYDGAFHMIDTSMSNLVTKDDGVTLADVEEAAADGARLVREHSLYSTSPNGFLTGTDTGRNLTDFPNPANGSLLLGFADDFCENGLKLRDYYYNWNRGHRYVLNLRDHESYTRYYHQLDTTAPYWIPSENVTTPDPAKTSEIDSANRFGNRANGSWVFTPSLASDWANSAYSSSAVTAGGGGVEPAAAGQSGSIVYKVQAGNAIASQSIVAQFSRTDLAATATISLSVNHGLTWQAVGAIDATIGSAVPVTVNLRDEVSARYETLLKIDMTSAAAPDSIVLTGLTITTITQVNAHALPQLNIGANTISIGAGDQSDTMVLWPDLRGAFWKNDAYDSSNIASQGNDVGRRYTAVVYPSVLTQDAYLTYRMNAPSDITTFTYGGRLYNFNPGSYIDFLHSFDGGATWVRAYHFTDTTKPWDVIHYETVTDVPAGTRTVLFKFLFHNTATTAFRANGVYALRMEVNHQPLNGSGRPLDVTFRWNEVQADRTLVAHSHRQRITTFPFTYKIDVGGSDHPVMDSIKVNLEDPSDSTPYGYSGTDPGGVKYVPMKRTDGTILSTGAPYTISRPPNGFQDSAPASNTTILTDGVVGNPLTGGASYWWGQCWAPGSAVDIQVDLGTAQSVGAFRAHLFGYPFWDGLQGRVQDTVEIQTSTDGATFASQGFLQTSLWRKDVPVNYMLQDDGRATGWAFELTHAPVSARYVRYHVTPKRSDLCISEVQVFDSVTYTPFDLRIALPGAPPPPTNIPPTISLTSPAANAPAFMSPATIAVAADAQDADGRVQRVDFYNGPVLIGSATAAPFAISWPNVAAGTYTLTAVAADNLGATTTSTPIAVTVTNPPPPPSVSLTSPSSGATFTAPATFAVSANATASTGGAIAQVQFFAGSTSIGVAMTAPYAVTWSNVAAGTYQLTAVATDTAGVKATSSPATVTVSASSGGLEPPWSDGDIGATGAAGTATFDGTTFTVAGAGADIWNAADAFHYVYQPLSGDGQLTARVASIQNVNTWSKAGVMIRETLAANSTFAQMLVSAASGSALQYRTATGGQAAGVTLRGNAPPYWVRIVRAGNTFTGYQSVDGAAWQKVGATTIPMAATVEIGLAVTSHVAGRLAAATFDQVVVGNNAPPTNAPPQVSLTSPTAGSAGSEPATISLAASASDADGSVVSVAFYNGATQIAKTTTSPFTAVWPSVAAGTYTLTAVATDDQGAATTSAPITITVAPATSGGGGINEIVLYPGVDAQIGGGWSPIADATAAGGVRLQNPDQGAPKVATPAAAPAQYFDLTFNADAGKPYRIWMRGIALKNSYNNDSVYAQFDQSVDASGNPMWRIGTTSGTSMILEDCSGCGVQGWGWADNGYGTNVLGPVVYFATSGPQRLRVQMREDGLGLDQIVLSAVDFIATAPGATKNDTTILPR